MISHCGFYLLLVYDEWCWTFFHRLVGHLYIFLGQLCIEVFWSFFNWLFLLFLLLLSCRSYSHILNIDPLSYTGFANIFSLSIDCLFTLFPILCDRVFKFDVVLFVYFVLAACVFHTFPKKSLPNLMVWCFPLCFFPRSLIVLGLKFTFLIHFQVIFVYGIR